jgi:hypothetical protein
VLLIREGVKVAAGVASSPPTRSCRYRPAVPLDAPVGADTSIFGYAFFPAMLSLVVWTVATSLARYRAVAA